MKKLLPIVFVAALLGVFALPEAPAAAPQDPADKESGNLATELAVLRQEVARQEALLKDTLAYLQNQAEAAGKLDQVFDRSEELGFIAGINFNSREVLLSGLRAYTAAQRKGVPGAPKKPAPADDKPAPPGDTR
ncbi:MAG: hypothetical protein O7B99_14515 [Planctomycetota bacterium]|nr:hypothetical protein [Planctomycetota bacterium]